MRLLSWAALAFCTTAAATDINALHSADCSEALARLQAQEDQQHQATPMNDAARARWQAMRQTAARRCLGGDGSLVSPSQHELRRPIAVAPIGQSPAIVTPPASAAPPAWRPAEPPLTLTFCDTTGCFASDGSRLTLTGAGLVGPKGLCTTQGLFVQCP
jgi:hypothetical protein